MKLQSRHYVEFALVTIVAIIILRLLYKWNAVPFAFGEFLFFKGAIWKPFVEAWPVFLLGISINIYKMATSTNPPEVHRDADSLPMTGFYTSLMAGILEEVTFRWVLLFGFMGLYWMLDTVLLDGALGVFVIEKIPWLNVAVTLGNSQFSLNPTTWTIGLAILSSNWKFQKGHSYGGPTGMILSWIAGLYFFSIMFKYGLFASMLVHFTFDMLVFLMLMIDIAIEKANGVHNANNRLYNWY